MAIFFCRPAGIGRTEKDLRIICKFSLTNRGAVVIVRCKLLRIIRKSEEHAVQAYMTQPRKRLLTYLHAHPDETLSAGQISRDLPEISVSAVYRNLAALEQDGTVRKVAKSGSREVFYQYMQAESCKAHLHLSCKKCGKTFHMDEAETEQLLQSIARVDGFAVDRADTVLYGVCDDCAEQRQAAAPHTETE